jgi:excisionase family DNA binding protein
MANIQHPAEETYLTPNQVAKLLKVSPVTVRHWALDDRLNFITTPGGHRRFAMSDIERFAREHGIYLNQDNQQDLRILIVDDNVELADYLAKLLGKQEQVKGVVVAHDGFEAGEQIHVFKPNIVLLDLMMPGLNGFETCHRIKQNDRTKHIRIVAMTGYPSDENVQRILSEGAEACLSKPVRAPELMAALGWDIPSQHQQS